MNAQRSILAEYMSLFRRPTIEVLARDSGIQKTRVFRLINGINMRLEEYLILKERIAVLTDSNMELYSLMSECELELSTTELKDLMKGMSRTLRKKKITSHHQRKLIA